MTINSWYRPIYMRMMKAKRLLHFFQNLEGLKQRLCPSEIFMLQVFLLQRADRDTNIYNVFLLWMQHKEIVI